MTKRTRLLVSICIAGAGLCAQRAAGQEPTGRSEGPRVLLRFAADSSVVGAFRFTGQATSQLVFDIPRDDPRNELLASVTAPRTTTRDIAGTVVSTPAETEAERRYVIYWLGYRLSEGEEERSLTSAQWDSIFQVAGRRAVLRFTARGQPLGVDVASDAVRPVAQSLADVLAGLALTLPADSVGIGGRWSDQLAVPVDAPDGSRKVVTMSVTYRLAELSGEPGGLRARIEFDGAPVSVTDGSGEVDGKYFGESIFSLGRGRYEQVMAIANLEVAWKDTGGLPPARTVVEWRGQLISR